MSRRWPTILALVGAACIGALLSLWLTTHVTHLPVTKTNAAIWAAGLSAITALVTAVFNVVVARGLEADRRAHAQAIEEQRHGYDLLMESRERERTVQAERRAQLRAVIPDLTSIALEEADTASRLQKHPDDEDLRGAVEELHTKLRVAHGRTLLVLASADAQLAARDVLEIAWNIKEQSLGRRANTPVPEGASMVKVMRGYVIALNNQVRRELGIDEPLASDERDQPHGQRGVASPAGPSRSARISVHPTGAETLL